MKPTKYFLIITSLGLAIPFHMSGQTDIKKEVEVVKPYEPVVSDAKKISILPQINDSVIIRPDFHYSISPSPIQTDFQLTPITAAKILSMPLPQLYNGYLKLGLGNYFTPEAELYVQNLRSKQYSTGIFVQQKSSTGDVTLANNQSVFAGYDDTRVTVFGKKFLDGATLNADASIRNNTVYRYGYLPDTIVNLNKDTIRQNYFWAGFNLGIQSTHLDSSLLFYFGNFHYNYFVDSKNNAEQQVNLDGELKKRFDKKMLGLEIGYELLNRNQHLDSTGQANALFHLYPWIGISTEEYQIKAGLDLSFAQQEGKSYFRPYPKAEFDFVAVQKVLLPFLGIYGKILPNAYSDIAYQNPYIRPGLLVENNFNDITYYGGARGSLGSSASYIASMTYSQLSHQYFFVNDTTVKLRNQFFVEYDKVQLTTILLEVQYTCTDELSFKAKTHLYQYTMTNEQYPWQMPNYDFTFSALYNMRNKIITTFDVCSIGQRHAKVYGIKEPIDETAPVILNGVLDFNLGLEYRYTKILSVWLKMNNFTASRYDAWNQFPSQRFNMMLGFSYAL